MHQTSWNSYIIFFYCDWGGTKSPVLRPLLAYCTSPRLYVRVIVEQSAEWRLAGETEVLGENLPQRHFVHHKSHLTRPGIAVGSDIFPTHFLMKTLYELSHACYIQCPSPPRLYHSNYVWQELQFLKLLIILHSFNFQLFYHTKVQIFLLRYSPAPSFYVLNIRYKVSHPEKNTGTINIIHSDKFYFIRQYYHKHVRWTCVHQNMLGILYFF
jgi:hypothetical protein